MTFDFEEISMKRLTILKMFYPSLTRDNASPEVLEMNLKLKIKFPEPICYSWFDDTFDTLLRWSQGKII